MDRESGRSGGRARREASAIRTGIRRAQIWAPVGQPDWAQASPTRKAAPGEPDLRSRNRTSPRSTPPTRRPPPLRRVRIKAMLAAEMRIRVRL